MQNYTVPLSKLAEHLDLETVYTPTNLEDIMICSPNVNRPRADHRIDGNLVSE